MKNGLTHEPKKQCSVVKPALQTNPSAPILSADVSSCPVHSSIRYYPWNPGMLHWVMSWYNRAHWAHHTTLVVALRVCCGFGTPARISIYQREPVSGLGRLFLVFEWQTGVFFWPLIIKPSQPVTFPLVLKTQNIVIIRLLILVTFFGLNTDMDRFTDCSCVLFRVWMKHEVQK